jgi:serpin B
MNFVFKKIKMLKMKNLLILSCILYFQIVGFSQKNATQESMNIFSFKLYEQLFNKTENCFFSPFSVYSALSMTYAGAKEATKLEMEKVLEINDDNTVHSDIKSLTNSIGLNRELQFLSSNSLWLQKNFKLDKEYSKQIEENYSAKSKNVDFANGNDREKARNEINLFVDKQTKGNIIDIIKPGVLSENTSMILINAVYFKSVWQTEFLAAETKAEKFSSSSGDSVDCKMMHTELKTNYYEDEIAQYIEIPYQNQKASMMVILPRDSKMNDFQFFNYQYFYKVLKSSSAKQVKLSLPAFKMDVNYDLADALKKTGMKSAFEPGANFSGITGAKDLLISSILHKSVIDVSEKGTEASSTTAVIAMRSTSVPSKEPVVFNANHSFIFLIKENSTGLILFIGYLTNPK